jgi:hypothetical protein
MGRRGGGRGRSSSAFQGWLLLLLAFAACFHFCASLEFLGADAEAESQLP